MSAEVKLKASERLAALEQGAMSVDKMSTLTARRVGEMELIMFNLSRENEVLKDALQLIHEKLEAVISLSNGGGALTDDNINDKVTELRANALEDKVTEGVESGNIVKTDEIGENSFVVSQELDKDGNVVNPRLQFRTATMVEELKDKFLGQKVGFLYTGEENKLTVEILEIYNFVEKEVGEQERINKGPGADSVSSGEESEQEVVEEKT